MRVRVVLKFALWIAMGIAVGEVLSRIAPISNACALSLAYWQLGWAGGAALALGLGALIFAIWIAIVSAFPGLLRKGDSPNSSWMLNRKVMSASALGLSAIGLIVFVLLLSGPHGCVSLPRWASIGGLIFLVLLYAASDLYMLRQSESVRALNRETSTVSLQILLPVLMGWAGMAHLGLAVDFSPLGVISVLLVITLIGSFIARKRTGLSRLRG